MPRIVVMMKPDGSFRPGMIHLAIRPATKPMMMVQMMLMRWSLSVLHPQRNAHLRLRLRWMLFLDRIFHDLASLKGDACNSCKGRDPYELFRRPLELRIRPG